MNPALKPNTITIQQRDTTGYHFSDVLVSGSKLVLQTDVTGSLVGLSIVPSSSYTLTASYAPAYLPLVGGTIDGDLVVNGTASISVLYSIYETSSYDIVTGSTVFGQDLSSTHQFTGSVFITGSTFTMDGTASFKMIGIETSSPRSVFDINNYV